MPRLTNQRYFEIHNKLRRYWLENQRLYAYLTPAEQWALHDFFQPSKELANSELLAYRHQITAEQPSLPQCAGRALQKLEGVARTKESLPATPTHSPKRCGEYRHVQVSALVHPEMNAQQIEGRRSIGAIMVDMGVGVCKRRT